MPVKITSQKVLRALVPILLLGGFCWLYRETLLQAAGQFLVVTGQPASADLIVVLGGDFWGSRVRTGAALAVAGYAPKVLISGPLYWKETYFVPESTLAIEMLARQGHRRELFEGFLVQGRSTIDEIRELASELRRRNVRDILLVTSDYHSRRACVAFFLEAPQIRARCIAAPDPAFAVDRWWEDATQRRRVRSEWTKLLGTIVLRLPHFLFNFADE
jgi:uncharacterized SAM-binding protein YcdF (DUF218 family)